MPQALKHKLNHQGALCHPYCQNEQTTVFEPWFPYQSPQNKIIQQSMSFQASVQVLYLGQTSFPNMLVGITLGTNLLAVAFNHPLQNNQVHSNFYQLSLTRTNKTRRARDNLNILEFFITFDKFIDYNFNQLMEKSEKYNNQEEFVEDEEFFDKLEKNDEVEAEKQQNNIEDEEEKSKEQKSHESMDRIQKLMLAIKAMTAMKLTREDNVAAEIIPNLFLGSVGVAFNKDSLNKHGITHILTCADKIQPRFATEFKYMCLPILDTPSENIGKYFRQAYLFISDALSENSKVLEGGLKNNVLVHCFAGKSRSTSFVLAYLMVKEKINLRDGLELSRQKRPIAQPNPGFILQLKLFEKELFGVNSDVTVRASSINKPDQAKEELVKDLSQEDSSIKEINDGIQQMKLSGDEEGAQELQNKIQEVVEQEYQQNQN
ncbi:dual specificity protein phosphatase 1 isoform 2 [Stylonychia lemnae]|uniref:protein-tyrosine-phosphatase n=1 Tax=Stylonychia lemnae TaxID=5949 RepID=A0A078BB41_STYLE|nr:dual specificity protein phosphatase 1 isoform 2 [Stylonychia lemnae]|eukprot:CDW90467.1 dual specificity protein phosphatase 1 isoform 2 [Stylonychia lemnae]